MPLRGGAGPVPQPHAGSLCWGHPLCSMAGREAAGSLWPGWLTWTGGGREPSWLHSAARGWPKSSPRPAQPQGLAASAAAAEASRGEKRRSSPSLLLRLPRAAKHKREPRQVKEKRRASAPPPSRRRPPAARAAHSRVLLGTREPLAAQLSAREQRWAQSCCPARRAAAAPAQHKCPSVRGGEQGQPAPAFPKLTILAARVSSTTTGDGRQLRQCRWALLLGLGLGLSCSPTEQMAAGMRKVAAMGASCAHMSPSHGPCLPGAMAAV